MSKNLVIVESPAKAKTIENYLGKDFIVKSSYGHVRDLANKGLAVDIEKNFEPQYEVSPDKKALVTELKKLAKEAETVWLATDEDREGEAISWHLFETLGLKKDKTKRIAFNEITKTAILRAIENPREINDKLVDAQQARRVLDRLVGFELSPVLWKKVKPSLSAGRVQSVAVRLIVEREREIQSFASESFYKLQGQFKKGKDLIKADLMHNLGTLDEARSFLEECKTVDFSVLDVQTKPAKKSSAAPFTTSTLQQEASLKLGFSVTRTMQVAQRLYESGRITYMRTDSVNLSKDAVSAAQSAIISNYGEAYSQPKQYTTKSAGAQEAHEAIRPTNFNQSEVDGDRDEVRLYDLIWKRAIASQMADAKLERTTIKIGNEKLSDIFQAKGEVILFDGFLKVYLESNVDDEEEEETAGLLPKVTPGEPLQQNGITATQRFSRPPARYVEASLVKKLEELGIGRPSTYAPTISTIQKRGYVEKVEREGEERKYTVLHLASDTIQEETKTEITGRDRNKLSPTDIGIVVNDFLVEHFDKVMNYNFTANVEKQFDDIAQGMIQWTEMLKEFYGPFHENVENTLEHSERATGERTLGTHPESGKPIIARIGRFGPMIQIGDSEDEEKPQFASLKGNQSINTITLEEALDLFKLPRIIGEFENKELKVNNGRFGPYVQHDGAFTSLGKEDDPMTITAERAIELIQAKRAADKAKIIKTFDEDKSMQLLNGRYGAYLKIGKNNFKLPKDAVPEDLTYEQCIEISQNQPEKKKGARKTTRKKK
ncbi:type I DNA topoisomerase [Wandonia haliotis]|uniref:DNA topoisomerase 1 n=1 Tax=Wandonia haliotis TaxID=574963 RepID=A0ABP3Y1B2_9FLAO